MKLMLRRSIALKEVLAQMPEVVQVWEARQEDEGLFPGTSAMPTDSTTPDTQVRLVVKITGNPEQLALAM